MRGGFLAALLVLSSRALGDAAAILVAGGAASLNRLARAPATRVELAPARDGSLGAWLVTGPFPVAPDGRGAAADVALDSVPVVLRDAGIDDRSLEPVAGVQLGGKGWTLTSSSEGPIDLKSVLHARGNDLIAYAAGTLHVEQPGRYLLLIGADDGLRVVVDHRSIFSRDESRPQRDDDNLIPLDLAAGDHPVLLKLHQRDAGWAFKVRLLDARLDPPEGAYLALPGTSADDARALAGKLSWVSLNRGIDLHAAGYHPTLTVRFPQGAPRGIPLRTTARLVDGRDGSVRFDVDAGEVPLDARGAGELFVTLPAIGAEDGPVDDRDFTCEVVVAGRTVKAAFSARKRVHDAIHRATLALAAIPSVAPWLLSGSRDSVTYLRDRLVGLASHADTDREAQDADARELDELSAALERGADPYAGRSGPMRRALIAPFDDKPTPFGLYVPPSFRPGSARRYPLIVGLHGLNGRPMAMIRYLFGFDDPKRENEWEDRHMVPLPPLDAFVVTPSGYGNTMYRDLGEDDVLRVVAWALGRYPIDPAASPSPG